MNKSFPFPDKNLALEELKRDPSASSLTSEEYEKYCNLAWNFGVKAAKNIFKESNGCNSFEAIIEGKGLRVLRRDGDNIVGNMRYFSEYQTKSRDIVIYLGAVAIWAEQNKMSLEDSIELILSHEFFHHLEANEIGFASRLVELPIIKIGNIKIGKKGIRALSEVGAHAFARTFWDLVNNKKTGE